MRVSLSSSSTICLPDGGNDPRRLRSRLRIEDSEIGQVGSLYVVQGFVPACDHAVASPEIKSESHLLKQLS